MGSNFFGIMLALGCLLHGTSVRGEKVVGKELIDLPWLDLKDQLINEINLIDTTPDKYVSECVDEFKKPLPLRWPDNLIDQPSGLCMMALYCAFESCDPVAGNLEGTKSSDLNVTFIEKNNPRYNLPPKVLFPSAAGDVVAAIKFAQDHNIEISVKNSGHHYAGGSTKRDTLHVNMNKYKEYTHTANGIIECNKDVGLLDMKQIMTNQACALATARKCPAFIRIGGGENWNNTYRAVDTWNDKTDGNKYHIVGGGAGTVSPMGWTFLGGLAGATLGRRYGLGADQVLQIEMVLPNGNHVRFGPTAWQKETNYLYPKTIQVTGECNKNYVSTDEEDWRWTECEDAINFDDLWFATLGGGGGTWGIVLSIHYQLHNQQNLYFGFHPAPLILAPTSKLNYTDDDKKILAKFAWEYTFDFLFDPTELNLTESDSNVCGGISHEIYCYEEASREIYFKGWLNHLKTHRPADLILIKFFETVPGYGTLPVPDSYTHASYAKRSEFPYMGGPPDLFPVTYNAYNPVFTKKAIFDNKSYFAEFLANNGCVPYFAFPFSSGAQIAHDQANSVPRSYRDGVMMVYMSSATYYDNSLFRNVALDDNTNDFPSIIGSNHAGPHHLGPLKSNWTSTCPLKWSQEKREKLCISQQQATYGSVVLTRLELIKESVDPTYMFDCHRCIGNNRKKLTKGKKVKKAKGKVKKSPKSTKK
mmetsp:Transcript_25787/g.30393  ORF Transcript_25787/g.30393 Transcript_25787/m.30393 type:complete len:701 (+) Transcript_25787:109-2211(+)